MFTEIEAGVVSGCVLQSVSFLKTLGKLCCMLTKITSYIEYLMRGIFNYNGNRIGRCLN